MNNDTKLLVELIKGMGKRLEDMKKEIEGVKTSYQYGAKVSKEFYDKACSMQDGKNDEQQKQIDNHCGRIRGIEKAIVGISPMKKFYDKIASFSIGVIILLGSTVIGLCLYLKDSLTK